MIIIFSETTLQKKTKTKTKTEKDWKILKKTKHMPYFRKAESVRISNMTFSTGWQGQGLQGLSRTFQDFQGLQGILYTFKNFQRLSRTFKDFPRLSRTFKEFQGLSRTSKFFQGIQGLQSRIKEESTKNQRRIKEVSGATYISDVVFLCSIML